MFQTACFFALRGIVLLLFSFLMAIIGAAISWKPIHQLAKLGKNKYPKWTISGNALLIFILPLIHPLAIIGSILLFLAMFGSKRIAKEEQQKQKDSCQTTGQVVSNHFVDTAKMVKIGSGAKRASANPITSKGVTEHQSFYDISTTPTPVAPDRRFSSTPKNRSAKGKPPTGAVVSFGYTNAQGEFSTRLVRISRCGLDYLEGFDLNKSASRTFRLDRIDGAVVDTDSGEVFYL